MTRTQTGSDAVRHHASAAAAEAAQALVALASLVGDDPRAEPDVLEPLRRGLRESARLGELAVQPLTQFVTRQRELADSMARWAELQHQLADDMAAWADLQRQFAAAVELWLGPLGGVANATDAVLHQLAGTSATEPEGA